MRTLLLDNYDSFTFNLYHLIAEVSGAEPLVYTNNGIAWEEIVALRPDAVVISPGPGNPSREADFGICARVIRELDVPILGVCLGHQGIAHAFGASIVHAPEPIHGRTSRVFHNGTDLFAGLPQGFDVVRYHSLVAARPLPDELEVTAWTRQGESKDELVMGLRHRTRPLWGVQFHPESICTEYGAALLENFYRRRVSVTIPSTSRTVPSRATPPLAKLACGIREETLFRRVFAHETNSYWLEGGRFAYMGCGEEIAFHGFDHLKRLIAEHACVSPDLPFDFNGGLVGYFGYELKSQCGGRAIHKSSQPDCRLMRADRWLALDRESNEVYVFGDPGQVAAAIAQGREEHVAAHGEIGALTPVQSREQYIANIHRALAYIRDGDSYEVCLTNKLRGETTIDPLDYYCALRRRNPAPHAAFLRFGDLAIASSSPERFLRIGQDGVVETKPIKGTAPRGANVEEDKRLRLSLAGDVKNRAENLMIVDLLRNDLGRVCEVGSVAVPKLMDVESFATTHQLVSTVTGRLRPGNTAVDCLHHAFPGGSMTGAPKLRTLEIIDELESEARGVYSGSIGYLAWNGSADLNIVIRTAVFEGTSVSIGAGGAIVALSDPAAEWDELLLKTRALTETFRSIAARVRV